MYFPNYGFQNARLKKYLKSPLSEEQSGSNMKRRRNTLEN